MAKVKRPIVLLDGKWLRYSEMTITSHVELARVEYYLRPSGRMLIRVSTQPPPS